MSDGEFAALAVVVSTLYLEWSISPSERWPVLQMIIVNVGFGAIWATIILKEIFRYV